MRILFYNHTELVSGAERVLLMICGMLDRTKFDVIVACPEGKLAERVRATDLPVRSIPAFKARFTWRVDQIASYLISMVRVARTFRRVVRETSPDLIHANSVRAGIVTSIATIGMPTRVIWHLHDIMKRHPISTAIRLIALARGLNAAVGVSKATASSFQGLLLRRFPSRVPVRVIYNGIETDRFRPDQADRARKRAELGLADDRVACGIIGLITPRKGQLELIRAFAEISPKVENAVLYIVGAPIFHNDSHYLEALKLEVCARKMENKIIFLGVSRDTPSLLRALDLVIVNSRSEPFSLVLLEALASGTPVLASRVDGIPELITDGQTGYLTSPGDPEELRTRLLKLILDLNTTRPVAEAGRRRATTSFTVERFLQDFENLYLTVHSSKQTKINPDTEGYAVPVVSEENLS